MKLRDRATINLEEMVYHRFQIQMPLRCKLSGTTEVMHVMAHVANRSQPPELLNSPLVIEYPFFMAVQFLWATTDFTRATIPLVHFLAELVPTAARNGISKVFPHELSGTSSTLSFNRERRGTVWFWVGNLRRAIRCYRWNRTSPDFHARTKSRSCVAYAVWHALSRRGTR